VSLTDDWHFGAAPFEALANIKSTHGRRTEGASVGFLTWNVDRLPETLRADDVYPWLELSRGHEHRGRSSLK